MMLCQVYLGYVELMMAGLQNLPEMPKRLKNVLEDEWRFTKHVCPYIRGGESNAGNRFRYNFSRHEISLSRALLCMKIVKMYVVHKRLCVIHLDSNE